MSRSAKKSDLVKSDLKDFSIGLLEARDLKITKEDLKGIKEMLPNEKYKIRATIGDRTAKTFYGNLLDAIKEKNRLNMISDKTKDEQQDKDMMFVDGISLFLDYCYEREARGDMDLNSVFDHIRKINSDITEFFGKYKLSDVDSNLIEKYIDYLRHRKNKSNPNQHISEQTIANNLRTLNAILNYLVLKKKIPNNPLNYVTNKPQAGKGKKELTYFKVDEAKYALKCIDKYADIRLKAFMNIIFSLGCRREEAGGLRWCDVDFKTNGVDFNFAVTSSIPKAYVRGTKRVRIKELKTDNSYRTNYLSNVAINYLRKYYQFKIACGFQISSDDPIFTTWRQGRNVELSDEHFNDSTPVDPNKLSAQWREFKKQYGIKNVDLHRIRHTVANILEKKGVPKKDVAKMLGNTERVLQEFYTHVDVEDLKRLRGTIDAELFNDIEYINLNIDLVVKILNEYPIETLKEEELKLLDLVSNVSIDSDNYFIILRRLKDIILTSDGSLNYFIDDNASNLNIKVETYKRFSQNNVISVKKEKDISIKRDILSF